MKRILASLLVAAPFALLSPTDASACGACLQIPAENTQVTGHRMILSISQTETTLWDQISYTGNPSSFAWVLPVKGTVEIGLSSDALFQNLETVTPVGVNPPPRSCPLPPVCGGNRFFGLAAAEADNSAGGLPPAVTVVSQQVVGPYETVVLHSSDSSALTTWLDTNGYVIPDDFSPVISAYVAEGFDFLALKLVPGEGVSSMRPVRVTTPGASATLPLRMVAGGTGVKTPITLWVYGEGRYEPKSHPQFVIDEGQLIWDYATSSSNYSTLSQVGFDATGGRGWLAESAAPSSRFPLQGNLESLLYGTPKDSGYGDTIAEAEEALAKDLDKLWGQIPENSLWVTRLHGELSRAALTQDLFLGASQSQEIVQGIKQAKVALNEPPCPEYESCGCSFGMAGSGGLGVIGAVLALAAAAGVRRRRR